MSWVKDNQINWVLKISCSSHKILNFYSTNISLSQSHSLKVSALVLSSTQSRIVSLYKIFCSWMKSLFWSYPLPRTEQDLFSKSAKVCSTTIRLLGQWAPNINPPHHHKTIPDKVLWVALEDWSNWDYPWSREAIISSGGPSSHLGLSIVQGSHHLIWGWFWDITMSYPRTIHHFITIHHFFTVEI